MDNLPAADVPSEKAETGVHSYRNKMKKRKKKFIANAKGFGKSGNFGRGTRLEGDEWSYFINIMDAIRSGFESLDEKGECVTQCVEANDRKFKIVNFHSFFQCQWLTMFLSKQSIKKFTFRRIKSPAQF